MDRKHSGSSQVGQFEDSEYSAIRLNFGRCIGNIYCPKLRACELLGQCVFEHDLIRHDPEAVEEMREAVTLRRVNRILKKQRKKAMP